MGCSYKSCALYVFVLQNQYYFTPYFKPFSGISCIETCSVVMDRYTATDFVRTLGVHSKLSTDDSIYQAQEQVAQIGETNDQRFPSHHDYRINDQLWLNGLAYQQLALRFNQINQSLNVANASCTQLQNTLNQRKAELAELTKRYDLIDASLKYEFKHHKETEKSLAHERNVTKGLIDLLNDVKLPETCKSNQIGILFRETQDMHQKLYDTNHEIQTLHDTLEDKENCIKTLEAEKDAVMTELEERIKILEQKIQGLKSDFLNYMLEEDDFSIEIATATTIGKRKRASICSIGCAE